MVAIRKGGDKLVIGHLDPSKYATQRFSKDPKQVPSTLAGPLRLTITAIGGTRDLNGSQKIPCLCRKWTRATTHGPTTSCVLTRQATSAPKATSDSPNEPSLPVSPGDLRISVLLQGVFEHLAYKAEQQPELTGLQILVEGRVPLGELCLPTASLCFASQCT